MSKRKQLAPTQVNVVDSRKELERLEDEEVEDSTSCMDEEDDPLFRPLMIDLDERTSDDDSLGGDTEPKMTVDTHSPEHLSSPAGEVKEEVEEEEEQLSITHQQEEDMDLKEQNTDITHPLLNEKHHVSSPSRIKLGVSSLKTSTPVSGKGSAPGKTRRKEDLIVPVSQDGKELFVCPICDLELMTATELTKHICDHNLQSGQESKFNCRLCDKELSSLSSLNRHMLVHSGERPFSCSICGMSFTTNGNMHRHMRTHKKNQSGHPMGYSPSLQSPNPKMPVSLQYNAFQQMSPSFNSQEFYSPGGDKNWSRNRNTKSTKRKLQLDTPSGNDTGNESPLKYRLLNPETESEANVDEMTASWAHLNVEASPPASPERPAFSNQDGYNTSPESTYGTMSTSSSPLSMCSPVYHSTPQLSPSRYFMSAYSHGPMHHPTPNGGMQQGPSLFPFTPMMPMMPFQMAAKYQIGWPAGSVRPPLKPYFPSFDNQSQSTPQLPPPSSHKVRQKCNISDNEGPLDLSMKTAGIKSSVTYVDNLSSKLLSYGQLSSNEGPLDLSVQAHTNTPY